MATLVFSGGLALWWLVRANLAGSPAAFLPFGASVLAFLAAYSVLRVLGDEDRHRLVVAIASVGSVAAAAGLAGVLFRWPSLATTSAGVWRAAATLTYPAGAATLFIVTLLVAWPSIWSARCRDRRSASAWPV